MFIEITERVGNDLARGFAFAETRCTGTFETTNVLVTAFDNPFKRGTAFATADFRVCDFTGCRFAGDAREISIVQ